MVETTVLRGGKEVELFTKAQIAMLTRNGLLHPTDHDAVPCAYLLGEKCSYIISEICTEGVNQAYGISNLNGKLALGFIDLNDLYEYHLNKEFLFNHETFQANHTISVFMSVANEFGKIVSDDILFADVFEKYSNQP